jgi:hypothetical protein
MSTEQFGHLFPFARVQAMVSESSVLPPTASFIWRNSLQDIPSCQVGSPQRKHRREAHLLLWRRRRKNESKRKRKRSMNENDDKERAMNTYQRILGNELMWRCCSSLHLSGSPSREITTVRMEATISLVSREL